VTHDEGSHAAAILDGTITGLDKAWGLRANRLAGAALVRKSARDCFSHANYLVFHNFAGMSMLSGSIPHHRRCLFLHTNSDDVFSMLPKRLPYLDTILVSGDDLESELRGRFPNLDIPVTAVEYPLNESFFKLQSRDERKVTVIGYSGRLEIEQKQVMRLAELCNHLATTGMDYRLEIAGNGSAEESLRLLLPPDRCRFIGVLDAHELGKAYNSWDFLICTSDYETGPLVAMEAMATGVVPVMPDIPCQVSRLLEGTGVPRYSKGDMLDAAYRILQLSGLPNLDEMRQMMRNRVTDRKVEPFIIRIKRVLEESARPGSIGKPLPVPHGISEYLPFAFRRSCNEYLR
jgi:glycosyltransferase involved in cell wall biosynthesis